MCGRIRIKGHTSNDDGRMMMIGDDRFAIAVDFLERKFNVKFYIRYIFVSLSCNVIRKFRKKTNF